MFERREEIKMTTKKNTKKVSIIIIVICIFIAVLAFQGIAKANDDASYFLLYNVNGTTYNAYVQSKEGMKQYHYTQYLQGLADIIGDDRTADIHEIERPRNAVGNVVLDIHKLTISSEAKKQFTDLQTGLFNTIKESYNGSEEVKTALIDEVEKRLERISKGNVDYMIPLDSYLKLNRIVYDNEENLEELACVVNGELDTFVYKEKSEFIFADGMLDFSEKDLTSSFFWGKNLKEISFKDSWLNQSVLAESDFSRGNLSGVNLLGAIVAECNMTDCDLSHANLSGTIFIGCDLSDVDFNGAQFKDTEFRSLVNRKVKVDEKWRKKFLKKNVKGIENINWQ